MKHPKLALVCLTIVGVLGMSQSRTQAQLTVTNNLQLWLKADAGVQTSGSSVTNWLDQSGNSNHAAQTNATSRPVFSAVVINGLPAVLFDGVNDFLRIPDAPGLDGVPGLTIFVVASNTANFASKTYVAKWRHSAQDSWVFEEEGSQESLQMFVATNLTDNGSGARGNSDPTFSLPINRWNIGNVVYDGAQLVNSNRLQFFVNGKETARTMVGTIPTNMTDASSEVFVGAIENLAGRFYDSYMSEILIYNTSLAPTDRQAVFEYLAAKYAIPEPSSLFLVILALVGLRIVRSSA